MSGGVFAVARNLFDHEFFADEPFTEREAWVWLIKEAAWKPRRIKTSSGMISLKRGQCAHSVRFMAEAWKWSKSRVDRFVNRLKIETMIGTDSGTGINIITICNYDEYQKVSLPNGTGNGTDSGTGAGQERDKQETVNTFKQEEISTLQGDGQAAANVVSFPDKVVGAPKPMPGKSPEAHLYRRGREILGRSSGGVITDLRKLCRYDDAKALSLIEQAAGAYAPMEWIQAVLHKNSDEERAYRSADWEGKKGTDDGIPILDPTPNEDWLGTVAYL